MIKQFVPQEVCLKCPGCCRFSQQDSVWSPCLLDEDIEILLKNNIPPSIISRNKKLRLEPHPGQDIFICPFFLPGENKCRIYALRPFECQLYPFLLNRRDEKIFLAVDLKCPFIAEKIKTPEFQTYLKYLTGLLNSPSYQNIIKNNPQLLQAYPEAFGLSELKI